MNKHFLTFTAILFAATIAITPMGKAEKDIEENGPVYIELQAEQGVYHAVIVNKKDQTTQNQAIIPGTEVSFNGYTAIDGIRRETDDSTTRLKLSEIVKIYVTDPLFTSKRYPEKEYTLVDVVTRSNQHVKQLLFPRLLVVCIKELPSKMEKSWFIRDLESVEVLHGTTPEQVVEKAQDAKMQNHFLQPIADFIKELGF